MLQIRVKQLSRKIIEYLKNNEGKDILSQKIFDEIFSPINGQTKFYYILENLDQIHVLGQIFARFLSQLSSDEINQNTFKKLYWIAKLGEFLIVYLSLNEDINDQDLKKKIKLSTEKFTKFQEELRTIKKNRNAKVNNVEKFVQAFIEESINMKIENFDDKLTWDEILEKVYGIIPNTCDVDTIEQVNIKELLLCEGIQGDLIEKIFKKYDGLLTFSMSLLTILSGTPEQSQFGDGINSILESLGSSTQITLITQRLIKNFSRLNEIQENIQKTIKKLETDANQLGLLDIKEFQEWNSKIQENFFNIRIFPKTPIEFLKIEKSELIHAFNQSARLREITNKLLEEWDKLKEAYYENYNALQKLDSFLDSIVKKANTTSASLFASGFRAPLPQQDVRQCEEAGLHLKNLVATSRTLKVEIDEELIAKYNKAFRDFEENWSTIKKFLKRKAQEESISGINIADERDIYSIQDIIFGMSKIINGWYKINVFEGHLEESPYMYLILEKILDKMGPIKDKIKIYEKMPLNQEQLKNYGDFYDRINKFYNWINEFDKLINILTPIIKKLWFLDRKILNEISSNKEYFLNPEMFEEKLNNISTQLKQEYRQRLILKEQYQRLKKMSKEVQEEVNKLKELSLEQRKLIL